MKNVNAYTGPQRFAHRGLVQAAPENTLGAFQGAVDGGYEGIEIDVQMTRDGEIVIAHDSNFTRMTLGHPDGGSNRRIRDLTWDEIQKIELPYANHLLSEAPPEHSEIELLATLPKLVMGQVEGRDYETALAEDGRMAHLMRFSDFDAWLTAQSKCVGLPAKKLNLFRKRCHSITPQYLLIQVVRWKLTFQGPTICRCWKRRF